MAALLFYGLIQPKIVRLLPSTSLRYAQDERGEGIRAS